MLIAITPMVTNANEIASFPNLQGSWFGQKTPGLIAEPFAPNTVSIEGRYEFGVSFSQDLKEMYFTTLDIIEGVDTDPQIYYSKVENNQWTKPQRANFTNSKMAYELTPHASLNENRVYFTGRKPDSKDWKLSGIIEKPDNNKAPSDLGVVGRYILNPSIFNILENTHKGSGDEIQLTDAISSLIAKEEVYAYEFYGKRFDCGSKLGFLKATIQYGLSHNELSVELKKYLKSLDLN